MNNNKKMNKPVFIFILLTLIILGTSLFWLVFLSESSIITETYATDILDAPKLYGKTYSLDKNTLILVVEDWTTKKNFGYMIKLKERTMGPPNFVGYRSFGKWAIVNAMIREGFPVDGELNVEFSEKDKAISIFVKGMADDPDCKYFETTSFLRKCVPIYKKRIVSKKAGYIMTESRRNLKY